MTTTCPTPSLGHALALQAQLELHANVRQLVGLNLAQHVVQTWACVNELVFNHPINIVVDVSDEHDNARARAGSMTVAAAAAAAARSMAGWA